MAQATTLAQTPAVNLGSSQTCSAVLVSLPRRTVTLNPQTGNSGSSQSASEVQGWSQAAIAPSPEQRVDPSAKLMQSGQDAGQVVAQDAQAPSLQVGVSPIGQEPQFNVPPQPLNAGPHCTSCDSQLLGTQHWPLSSQMATPLAQQSPSQQTVSQSGPGCPVIAA